MCVTCNKIHYCIFNLNRNIRKCELNKLYDHISLKCSDKVINNSFPIVATLP